MILLTPGPTPVPQRVLDAMHRQPIPHRSAAFEGLLAECCRSLSRLFGTTGPVPTLAGSGTTAMEAAIWSLAPTTGSIIACHSGKFGARWAVCARRVADVRGVTLREVTAPWGEPIAPDRLAEAIRSTPDVRLIIVVHCETSTATVSDAAGLSAIVHELAPDASIVMDGVTTVGALSARMDEWGIDAVGCASQKALGLPPGLGFVALSERAVRALGAPGDAVGPASRRTVNDVPLSLDLAHALAALERGRTPFTPPINLIFGLREALALLDEDGLAVRQSRCAALAAAVREAVRAAGLALPSRSPSDSVTAIEFPDALADPLRAWCAAERGVLLAGGQAEWAGRVVRMSHMGFVEEAETRAGVGAILAALEALAPGRCDTRSGAAALDAALGAGSVHGAPR